MVLSDFAYRSRLRGLYYFVVKLRVFGRKVTLEKKRVLGSRMQGTVQITPFIEINFEKKAFENFRGRFWPEGDLEFFCFDNELKGTP